MTSPAADLFWLLPPPEDFRHQLRALTAGDGPVTGAAVAALARHALDGDQLIALARAIAKAGGRLAPAPLAPVRLALMADGTLDHLAPALTATGARHGLLLDVYRPGFNSAMREAAQGEPALAAFAPEVAMVAPDARTLGLTRPRLSDEEAADAVTAALVGIGAQCDGLARLGASLVLATVPAPAEPWLGSADRRVRGSPAAMVAALNEGIAALAGDRAATLLDLDRVAADVGRARWFDAGLWHQAKIGFALDCVPLWADHVARTVAALRGKARKCLVLDLDNTLWGGVIGDDGVEGIRIGQGSADGEAHLAVQQMALDLKARGVVLAVVSKNEDDAARIPFRQHPDMLLKESDIAVFIANWQDKATNIAHVAKTLNIGTDALAFLDDNPAERARVRQMLPEVAVPEVPADPSRFAPAVLASGLFDSIGLSADDLKRAEQYAQNAERQSAMEKIGDYDAYLRSLEMVCDIRPFDAVGRTRIAQLVNKSNQFNVTTRRYTEADIAAFEADPQVFDLQIRLVDRFGDNGMISVVIFRKGAAEWVCDTWLMSCRVLGRRVEEAALAAVAGAAKAAGAERLVGEYFPSPKNAMVADLFQRLGFTADGAAAADGTRWVLPLADWEEPAFPMTITGAPEPARAAA
jgi:FkbH-like protein